MSRYSEEARVLNDVKGVVRSLRPTHNRGKADNDLNAAITLVLARIDDAIEAIMELPA